MDLMGNIVFKMMQNRIAQVRTRDPLGHDTKKWPSPCAFLYLLSTFIIPNLVSTERKQHI